MPSRWHYLKSVWQALTRSTQLDAAMDDEMRFHLEMETERLIREEGLGRIEAKRRAAIAFGGLERYKEAARDTRGLRWLDAVSLDLRLGLRMLVKYRGLTLVGGFAMAVAVAIGATGFEVFNQILSPSLPFKDGDHIVALRYGTQTPGSSERRIVHDFIEWRDQLTSVEQLGAFRTVQHNLILGDGAAEPVPVAELTASAFTIAQQPPLLGRHLLTDDERMNAAAVMVIGHDVWRTRFAGDPHVIGRTVALGGQTTTIVGVMPQGFRFPIDHQYWIPFRADAQAWARLEGPAIFLFGRLSAGASIGSAQAELSALARRTAAEHPETHGQLRAMVLPYTHEHLDVNEPFRVVLFRLAQIFVCMLTFVVAVNVAILVYARTVTRSGEIALRTALGASRRRILVQLFFEALALTAVGVAAGLALAHAALVRLESLVPPDGAVPFWIRFELSLPTVASALAVSILAAIVIGVLPGLKATSRGVTANMRELDSRSGARLGGVWTTLIVTQVAVAVAILPMALLVTARVVRMGGAATDGTADRIGVVLVSSGEGPSAAERGAASRRGLITRLEALPGVMAVTTSSGVPGFAPGRLLRFESAPDSNDQRVKSPAMNLGVDAIDVGPTLFEVYGAQTVAGRTFNAADLGQTHAVAVNIAFVRAFLSDAAVPADALGVRFTYVSPYHRQGTRTTTAYQVVSVVEDFPRFPREPGSDGDPTVYHPVAAERIDPAVVTLRFASSVPLDTLKGVRALAAEVDPALQVRQVSALADYYQQLRAFWRYLAWGVGLLTVSVVLLSAAGMYALLAFTVAQRTREIAIRSALGAAPRRLLLTVFGRASRQILLGIGIGAVLAAGVFQSADVAWRLAGALLLSVAVVICLVGLAAAAAPARRGLQIEPSDALRFDG